MLKEMTVTRMFLRLKFLMVVLFAIGCGSTPTTTGSDPKKDLAAPKQDLSVIAEEIAKEFNDDKSAAEKKFHGKVLAVEGVVEEVTTRLDGQCSVRLRGNKA